MRGEGLCCETPQERGSRMMKEAGYSDGGEVPAPPRRAVNLRAGGEVPGHQSRQRPDRKGKHTTINVIVARGGGDDQEKQQAAQQGLRAGVQLGARAAASKMAPPGAPPMGAPPGGMPPRPPMAGPPGPGGPPMGPLPPQMAAHGGEVKVRAHARRKAGGAVA